MDFELIQFEESAIAFKRLVSRLHEDLKVYALKPNANPKSVAIKNEQINRMYVFLDTAEQTVLNYAVIANEAYSNGYHKAQLEAKQQTKELSPQEKDFTRAESIAKLKKEMPHLF